jgi:hypothetical protein
VQSNFRRSGSGDVREREAYFAAAAYKSEGFEVLGEVEVKYEGDGIVGMGGDTGVYSMKRDPGGK